MTATPTKPVDPGGRRPRVLMISAAFPPMIAGESGHALHLASHLAAAGVDLHVLTTDRPGTRRDYPFAVHPVMRGWGWRQRGRLAAMMRQIQPDATLLIYAGWNYGHHPMVTLAASMAKRVNPASRFVTQVEYPSGAISSSLGPGARLASKLVRLAVGPQCDYSFGTLLSDSDGVIALSHNHLDVLTRRHPAVADKADVFPPPPLIALRPEDDGAARGDGRCRLGIRENETLLAYVGLIAPGKGIETLLYAFDRARANNPALRLVMIGGTVSHGLDHHADYSRQVHALCDSLGLGDGVIWTGRFDPGEEMASTLLRAADVAVLPWDPGVQMNNSSVANVAAHHLPIIATRPDRLEPMFVDGENVLLCAPRDAAGLADAIERVVSDAAVRAKLTAGARRLSRDWYSWEATTRRTLRLLGVAAAAGQEAPVNL